MSPRAPKKCGRAGCETRVTATTYCTVHTPVWRNPSHRRERLPADWDERRDAVRARAHGRCQALTHHPDCTGLGTECDHITPGDNHHLTNLQWLSTPCHKAKTATETRQRNRARASRNTHR